MYFVVCTTSVVIYSTMICIAFAVKAQLIDYVVAERLS